AAARQAASAAAAGWAPLHAEAQAATARAEAARGLAERAKATLYAARAHLTDVDADGVSGTGLDPEATLVPGTDFGAAPGTDTGELDTGELDTGDSRPAPGTHPGEDGHHPRHGAAG
ncbi:MAG TPA: hypothetical protein VFP72_01550, partial [Kineosporiaceae bacterium]|nr:hypothetical protein [Kineosporiaceae bacterium]